MAVGGGMHHQWLSSPGVRDLTTFGADVLGHFDGRDCCRNGELRQEGGRVKITTCYYPLYPWPSGGRMTSIKWLSIP